MDLQRESRRVGIVYDEGMCKHARPFGKSHPEQPQRIKVIWDKLCSAGLVQRCVMVNSKEASDDELSTVHSQKHIKLIRNISSSKYDKTRDKLANSFNSIYFNKGSSSAALLAAGSVVQISEKVALGELDAGVAVVRPPGHHAEVDKPMGFCLFNNVAIAAQHLVHKRPELGIHKVLIVDWDVHHGNGTQNMFWTDPQVLYFSVHRFDSGTFYPGGDDGNYKSIGGGPGTGYNINVPWKQGNCGDADYLAVWDHVLIPVAKSYDPDIILISGGFDAALGDPLGGCRLTPYGYSLMTHKLMEFAGGKIVLALEGGYNLESLADSFASCVEALLADKLARSSSVLPPFESTWDVIQAVRQELRSFWPALNEDLPLPVLIKDDVLQSLEKLNVSSSDESSESGHEEFAEAGKITVNSTVLSVPFAETTESIIQPLTELKVDDDRHDNKGTPQSFLALNCDKGFPMTVVPSTSCYKDCNESALVSVLNDGNAFSWRELLRKTHIWYACYGSNMWKRRFLCYIKGGKVEGMSKDCSGSVDKTPPQDMQWKMVPHRLFFGRSYTQTWGSGGVSFLHPIHSGNSKAHVCLYKITLEQFNDLLLQENCMSFKTDYPLVDIASVDAIRNENRILNVIEVFYF
ncbi:histone deacetylase 5 isoform X2 [Cryptomeria japonica]|uniref:histone deacetylase 5 isoform X2 n=1 Tax=Cryptomeria japonica TaxID=3369 RepID=UPI0025ABECFE|nr:histone deacetylase 5 isoform X2 [Cryptomeria japonica]